MEAREKGANCMDIVVTIPKKEYDNDDRENEVLSKEGGRQFWAMKGSPNIAVGERVYFVKHGRIDHSMRVDEIRKKAAMQCDVTDRQWYGNTLLIMNDRQPFPITFGQSIAVRGFQGFRYKWW